MITIKGPTFAFTSDDYNSAAKTLMNTSFMAVTAEGVTKDITEVTPTRRHYVISHIASIRLEMAFKEIEFLGSGNREFYATYQVYEKLHELLIDRVVEGRPDLFRKPQHKTVLRLSGELSIPEDVVSEPRKVYVK